MPSFPSKDVSSLSDQDLLQGLWDNDIKVVELIYQRYLPEVTALVKQYKGNRSDALDVFQDTLIVIFNKAEQADFQLTSSFGAYLKAVARFIWLRKLKKKSREERVTPELLEVSLDEALIEQSLINSEKRALFREKLSLIPQDCQKVLNWFFAGKPLKEIASAMNYSDDYIKKKNRICKQKLADLVKNDPRFHELTEEK